MSRFRGKFYIAQEGPIPWAAMQKYRNGARKADVLVSLRSQK
jgi:hypothetical protein